MTNKLLRLAACTLAAVAAAAVIGGCTDNNIDSEKLQVYAGIYPLYYLAKQIGGDKAQVYSVLPYGGDAHGFAPSLQLSVKMSRADILAVVGAGMESWYEDFEQALDEGSYCLVGGSEQQGGTDTKDKLVICDTSVNISLIGGDGSIIDDGHEQDHDGHSHDIYDPHIWTSLRNMQIMADTLLRAFKLKDPHNSDYYTANCAAVKQKLAELDSQYTSALAAHAGSTVVVAHKAFGYLCRDYGLVQEGIQKLSTQQDVSPTEMVRITQLIMERQVKVIFWDSGSSAPAHVNSIAYELSQKSYTVEVRRLSPAETMPAADGKDYIGTMQDNLAALLYALR